MRITGRSRFVLENVLPTFSPCFGNKRARNNYLLMWITVSKPVVCLRCIIASPQTRHIRFKDRLSIFYGILNANGHQMYAGNGGCLDLAVFLELDHGRVEDVRTEKRQEGSYDSSVLSGEVLAAGGFARFVESGVPGTLLIDQLHHRNNSVFPSGAREGGHVKYKD